MHPLLSLLLGLAAAAAGGELFVRSAVGLAHGLRIPAALVGATVAAFATSSPELAVAISAARAGTPAIALGDALGSNVVNVAFILGVALLIGPLRTTSGTTTTRDFPVALLVPFGTLALLLDGELSRVDGAILLGVFAVWLGVSVASARRTPTSPAATDPSPAAAHSSPRKGAIAVELVVGLGLLILAGHLIVTGAKWIGGEFGWSPFVVGTTLVAIGTSVPELATTLISRLRGHDEVGLGTLLGSNIFNGLLIVGTVAVMVPIPVNRVEAILGLGAGAASLVLVRPGRDGVIRRAQGYALLAVYVAYVAAVILRGEPGG